MSSRMLQNRIERAERVFQSKQAFAQECICFPAHERPFFADKSELDMLMALKCPIHGQRFIPPRYQVYVSKWLREKKSQLLWTHHSEQYRKAWFATFPPTLWPAQELIEHESVFLKLKDGTKVRAYTPTSSGTS
jgi:hypothetical protein